MKKITLKEIELQQQAYITCVNGDDVYVAVGKDKKGNTYKIIWDISPDYDGNNQEEDEACDWANPIKIEIIEKA